jgi:hypothetical protein
MDFELTLDPLAAGACSTAFSGSNTIVLLIFAGELSAYFMASCTVSTFKTLLA